MRAYFFNLIMVSKTEKQYRIERRYWIKVLHAEATCKFTIHNSLFAQRSLYLLKKIRHLLMGAVNIFIIIEGE